MSCDRKYILIKKNQKKWIQNNIYTAPSVYLPASQVELPSQSKEVYVFIILLQVKKRRIYKTNLKIKYQANFGPNGSQWELLI